MKCASDEKGTIIEEARCVTDAARASYALDVIVGKIIENGRKYLSMTRSDCCRLTPIMNEKMKSPVFDSNLCCQA